ncbi:hypothetical protein K458DRAFT_421315 [Lentithecium fluviatile CBS 122367]|uniref:Uncharacterized protein n=1 Tax=Lentithecium fluviatile CBS 122367 TaxID=1168545 RepID=A0A6G1IRX0_9PLEO|nr:hypothetical protein K458DRAFT_421315 [Lentithecium fluviatile CBS 122367]
MKNLLILALAFAKVIAAAPLEMPESPQCIETGVGGGATDVACIQERAPDPKNKRPLYFYGGKLRNGGDAWG